MPAEDYRGFIIYLPPLSCGVWTVYVVSHCHYLWNKTFYSVCWHSAHCSDLHVGGCVVRVIFAGVGDELLQKPIVWFLMKFFSVHTQSELHVGEGATAKAHRVAPFLFTHKVNYMGGGGGGLLQNSPCGSLWGSLFTHKVNYIQRRGWGGGLLRMLTALLLMNLPMQFCFIHSVHMPNELHGSGVVAILQCSLHNYWWT